MSQASELDRVASIVLRFMRGPLLMLVIVYAIGMAGFVLIPGQDADGNPAHMGFFHALYFMTYTATTTGFGEIPYEFTDAQRMWAIAILYMSVITWIYAIGSIIGLVQNPHFQRSLAQRNFAKSARRLVEPYVILCGFGDTGSLLARGLSDRFIAGVVIDGDPERIKALKLRDYNVKMPGLCGDPGVPKTLLDAGIRSPLCRAVVTITGDEATNLKVAVMARLLNPAVRVIGRSTEHRHDDDYKTLGVTVVDPFETFADQLCIALQSPTLHTLDSWLVGAHGVSLERPLHCPSGKWILCGYGRMGGQLYKSLHAFGITVTVIDPALKEGELECGIVGPVTQGNLIRAGVRDAVGVVVCTNSDTINLEVLIAARALNPETFIVIRQNQHENEIAFQAGDADLIMQPSLVAARYMLFDLVSPRVEEMLGYLRDKQELLHSLYSELHATIGRQRPWLWTVCITAEAAPAVMSMLETGTELPLGVLLSSPSGREPMLHCVLMCLVRNGEMTVLPSGELCLQSDDELLLCGTRHARRQLDSTLHNIDILEFLFTGEHPKTSYLMDWMRRRLRNGRVAASAHPGMHRDDSDETG
jgi:Trk K+ transport system NAD-binding subunit